MVQKFPSMHETLAQKNNHESKEKGKKKKRRKNKGTQCPHINGRAGMSGKSHKQKRTGVLSVDRIPCSHPH